MVCFLSLAACFLILAACDPPMPTGNLRQGLRREPIHGFVNWRGRIVLVVGEPN
jgi:hypothetical protein